MAKELLSEIPDNPKILCQWDELRISFINFLHVVKCAISKNGKLINSDQRDYHKAECEKTIFLYTYFLENVLNLTKIFSMESCTKC